MNYFVTEKSESVTKQLEQVPAMMPPSEEARPPGDVVVAMVVVVPPGDVAVVAPV